MNWDALAAIAELCGAAAVVATLVYLSTQVRYATKQAEIESLRHTWDSLNGFCDALIASDRCASIVNRGRSSLATLDPDERLIFDHIHLRLLNTLESWHLQVDKTSAPGSYRDSQLSNIAGIAGDYFGFPGTRELWAEVRRHFLPVQKLIDDALASELKGASGAGRAA